MEAIKTKKYLVRVVLEQRIAIGELVDMLLTLSDTYSDEISDNDQGAIEELTSRYFDATIEGDTVKAVLALQEWAAND